MAKTFLALAMVAVLALVAAGCAPVPAAPESLAAALPTAAATPGVPKGSASNPTLISAAELSSMLQNKNFVLINVHVPFEDEIPGTDAHIPYNEIKQRADQLPADKNARIVVYCRSGPMSAIASKTLVEMGYTNVFDVQGGMGAWQAAGYELLKNPRTATVTPPTSATPVVTGTVSDIPRIAPAEAKLLLDNGTAVLYDTRSAESYQTQHAAGALSFPDTAMEEHYPDLPTGKTLIFYCT